MAKIEERVLSMKFDNKQFQSAAAETVSTLDKLKSALNLKNVGGSLKNAISGKQFDGFAKGAQNAAESVKMVSDATDRVSMAPLNNAIGTVQASFSTLQMVAFGALASIGSQAVATGSQMLKSFTVAPIMDGFTEYETKINAIQRIQANTAYKGTTMDEITTQLDALNEYSDRTIYNFGEMTDAIARFTTSGVDVDVAASSIKGLSNLAALSGATSAESARVNTQIAQALGGGDVRLQDWMSVENAGMDSQAFKSTLYEVGKQMGTIENAGTQSFEEWTNAGNKFRDTLADGWLTVDVLTESLEMMSNDLTEADIVAMGYTEDQAKYIKQQAQLGFESASNIRTATQLLDTLKESTGSAWVGVFESIFGGLDEATDLFTNMNNVVEPILTSFPNMISTAFSNWALYGGRAKLFDSIAEGASKLAPVLGAVGEGFSAVFRPLRGMDLKRLSDGFAEFVDNIKISEQTINNVRRTFTGFFSIFSIVGQVFGPILSGIGQIFGIFSRGTGSVLSITASLGDFITRLAESGVVGETVSKIVETIVNVIDGAAGILGNFGGAFSAAFSGAIDIVSGLFDILERLGSYISGMDFSGITSGISSVVGWFSDLAGKGAEALGGIFSEVGMNDILGAGLLGGGVGIVMVVRNLIKKLTDALSGDKITGIFDSITGIFDNIGGVFESVSGVLDGLTESLAAMQQSIKATTILKIAAAITLLAISISMISGLDAGSLVKSITAIVTMLGALMGGLYLLTLLNPASFVGLYVMGAVMQQMAVSIILLAAAVRMLSGLSWGEMAQGLVGVAAAMGLLIAALWLMPTSVMAGIGMKLLVMAAALNVMALAVRQLANLSWEELGRGLAGLAGVLTVLIYALWAMPDKAMAGMASKLMAMAISLNIFALAVRQFASMSWEEMGRGLAGVAGMMAILAVSLRLLPTSLMVNIGVKLLLIGAALNVMAIAVKQFASLSWEDMARGLVGVGASLLIMALGLAAMPAERMLTTALGLIGVAAALVIMAHALQMMGGATDMEMLTALGTLALSLGILALALKGMEKSLSGAAALGVAALGLIALAAAMQLLSNLGIEGVALGLVAMAGAFLILGVASAVIGPTVPALLGLAAALGLVALTVVIFSGASVIFAAAVAIVVNALTGLEGVGWGTLIGGMLAIMGIFGVFIAAGMLLAPLGPVLLIVAAAMAVFSLAVIGMAFALQMLAGIPFGELVSAAGGLAVAFLILGGAAALLGIVSPLIALFGASLLIVAAAMTVFAGAVWIFADAMEKISNVGGIISDLADRFFNFKDSLGGAGDIMNEETTKAISAIDPSAAEGKGADVGAGLLEGINGSLGNAGSQIDMSSIANALSATDLTSAMDMGGFESVGAQIPDSIQAGMGTGIDDLMVGLPEQFSGAPQLVEGAMAPEMFTGAGTNISDGVTQGLESGAPTVEGAANTVVSTSASAAEGTASAEFPAVGTAAAQGMASGMDSSIVMERARQLARDAKAAAEAELQIRSPSRVFRTIGQHIVSGFANGMDNHATSDAASREMAGQVIAETKKVLDINSPSGVFIEIGEDINEGLAQGIIDSANRPADAMTKVIDRINAIATDGAMTIGDKMAFIFAQNPVTWELDRIGAETRSDRQTAFETRADDVAAKVEELQEAIESSDDAIQSAIDSADQAQESADKTKKDEKKSVAEKERAQRKADTARKKIAKEEKKAADARTALAEFEMEKEGYLAGAAWSDGVIDGLTDEDGRILSESELVSRKIYEQYDEMNQRATDNIGVLTGIQSFGDAIDSIGDNLNKFERALGRFNDATNPDSRGRHLETMFDSVVGVAQGLQEVGSFIEVLEPFLPGFLAMLDTQLPAIIPIVAQFAPQLASVLGGGLTAALPMIAGPIAGVVAVVGGLLLFFHDMGQNQDILKFFVNLFDGVMDFIANIPTRVGELITSVIRGIREFILILPKLLPAILEKIIYTIVQVIVTLPELLVNIALAIVDILTVFLTTPSLIIDMVVGFAEAITNGVVHAFQSLWDAFFGVGDNLMKRIIDGMITAFWRLIDAVLNPIEWAINSIIDMINAPLSFLGLNTFDHVNLGVGHLIREIEKFDNAVRDTFGWEPNDGFLYDMLHDSYEWALEYDLNPKDRDSVYERPDFDLYEEIFGKDKPVIELDIDADKVRDKLGSVGIEGGILDLEVANSYASGISADREDIRYQGGQIEGGGSVTYVEYTQNNTSPAPLSAIDIYRNTQKQLEMAK